MMNNFKFFPGILSLSLLLTSCFSAVEDNVESLTPNAPAKLKVSTRAVTGQATYPIDVLAYDMGGNLASRQTLQNAEESISMQLAEGIYHITALSGHTQYLTPSDYSLSTDRIFVPEVGYAQQPLMMGGADVVLSSGSNSVNLVMTYRVASLQLDLANVPAEVTAVKVSVSPQFGAIDLKGTLSGTSSTNLSCRKQGNLWSCGPVYIFPGSGSTTTLTLSLTDNEGQQSFSYQLAEPLEAAVPYSIHGTYVTAEVPRIEGMLTIEGWQSERSISFDFGTGSSAGSGGNSSGYVPTIAVNALPQPGSAWLGHAVALRFNESATEADLLLWALTEFNNVHAPAAAGYETEMATIANSYTEGDLTHWTVPTESEARQLKETYGGHFDDFNAVIEIMGGSLITVSTASNNARYLCESGTKTFNFAENGSLTTAGTSVKYRLRMVKKVHVVLKDSK